MSSLNKKSLFNSSLKHRLLIASKGYLIWGIISLIFFLSSMFLSEYITLESCLIATLEVTLFFGTISALMSLYNTWPRKYVCRHCKRKYQLEPDIWSNKAYCQECANELGLYKNREEKAPLDTGLSENNTPTPDISPEDNATTYYETNATNENNDVSETSNADSQKNPILKSKDQFTRAITNVKTNVSDMSLKSTRNILWILYLICLIIGGFIGYKYNSAHSIDTLTNTPYTTYELSQTWLSITFILGTLFATIITALLSGAWYIYAAALCLSYPFWAIAGALISLPILCFAGVIVGIGAFILSGIIIFICTGILMILFCLLLIVITIMSFFEKKTKSSSPKE